MTEVTQTRQLAARKDRVFTALVDPDDLVEWFCDSADVEPRVGGRYVFGGRHAYGGPASAHGRFYSLNGAALSFVWPLAGSDTTVTYELAESAGGTSVTARYTGVERYPYEVYNSEHATAVWSVLLRQLAAHAEGHPLPRWDFTRVPPKAVRSELRGCRADRSRVWEMLTVPALMNRWIAKDASVDLHAGGRYSYGWPEDRDGPQVILELEPPQRLVVSWRAADVLGAATWHLIGGEKDTVLTLTHEGLPDSVGVRRDYDMGWWDFIVDLKRLVESP